MELDWFSWAILSAVFAALTTIFAKLGVSDVDSDVATLYRMIIIIPLLTLYLAHRGLLGSMTTMMPRSYLMLTLSALATGASWLCYFRALQNGDAARVAPVDKLSLVIVAVLAVSFLGETLSLRHWFGIALVATGVGLVAWK